MLKQGKTADDLSSEGSVDMMGGMGNTITDSKMFQSEDGDVDEIKRMDDGDLQQFEEEVKDSNQIPALASAQSDVFYKPAASDKVVFTDSDEDDQDKFANQIINQQQKEDSFKGRTISVSRFSMRKDLLTQLDRHSDYMDKQSPSFHKLW